MLREDPTIFDIIAKIEDRITEFSYDLDSVKDDNIALGNALCEMEQKLTPNVSFRKLTKTAHTPTYAHEGDAGADIRADLEAPVKIYSEQTVVIPTGIALGLSDGFEAQVRSRSGLSVKGIVVANSPGTIDCGYRGEIKVILHNHGPGYYIVEPGDKIAQLVVAPVVRANFVEVKDLDDTERGAGGFGSTGAK